MLRLLIALMLLAPEKPAAVPVTVHLEWTASLSSMPARRATVHARRADGDHQEIEIAAEGTTAMLPLPAGQWFVSAASAGWWSEPRLVAVLDHPAEVTIELERATRVHARVKFTPPGKAAEMTIHLQTTEPQTRTRAATCAIAGDAVDCDVPAGKSDLVFRVPGYASLFRWSETLAAPQHDLGTLAFRRGSTFSGRVEMPREAMRVDVILTPAAETLENDAYRIRKNAARIVAQPNVRGYFAFNVAPGRYVVQARSGELASEEEEVNVVEGREAVLRDTLRLEPPRTLTVSIHPPIDPWNKPWKVTLSRRNGEKTATANSEGIARFEGQMPALYSVSVRRSNIDEWASSQIDLAGDATLDINIATTRVRGSVELGGKPLAALITFIGDKGLRLPVRSKADGSFLTLLPRVPDDKWRRIEIDALEPRVHRSLSDVTLTGADTEEAFLDLQLPATSLAGLVVDSTGMPARNALVNVAAPDGDFKQIESEDGRFTLAGLAPGHYRLTASTRDAESDKPLEVDLAEDAQEVTLIIEPFNRLRGMVRSNFGTVTNASIFVVPAGSDPPVVSVIPVNAEGRFDVRLPPRTDEVFVTTNAPGFSFRMMRMTVPRGSTADVAIDQQGGALTIDSDDARGPLRPYLVHNGVAIRANIVGYLSGARPLGAAPGRISFEIPQIEAGSYSLCWMARPDAPADRCASGTLARHGTLKLGAPSVQGERLQARLVDVLTHP